MDGIMGTYKDGIYQQGDARLSDLAGYKVLPVGNSDFASLVRTAVFVDKSMLVADILRKGPAVTLFCRPRRFGKSLNLSMLQRFFEIPVGVDAGTNFASLFQGLAIWEAEGGRFREHQGAYPVVRFTFNSLKRPTYEELRQALGAAIAAEYRRHQYLAESDRLGVLDRELFLRMASGCPDPGELERSLLALTTLLHQHHGKQVVVLIDEYDAPVMSAYTNGYYDSAISLLKSWLTGALKDNPSLAMAVLTGVQRISKESIFSDLNNMDVDTPLNVDSDERFGFTQAEVEALACYRGQQEGVSVAREWYDGYRFGNADVYNPWSLLNYLKAECQPDVYWGNTSSNGVLGDLVRGATPDQLSQLYALLKPDGYVEATLDTRVVFPDVGVRPEALWSMLYLSGYVTTGDTRLPGTVDLLRRLSVPNREVRILYRQEITDRFATMAGGVMRLADFHAALVEGDAEALAAQLEEILLNSASHYDLTSENSYHMLVMGLLFGVPGYGAPASNRERGRGRFDVQLVPEDPSRRPLITLELKFAKCSKESNCTSDDGATALGNKLAVLAAEAVAQIDARAYDAASGAAGALRWSLAFSGKSVACACEKVR